MLLELFGALSALIYLWLEIKQKSQMWIIGIVSGMVYVAVFSTQSLYASAGIQAFFVIMSIYGWISWSRQRDKLSADPFFKRISAGSVIIYLLLTAALTLLLSTLLRLYSNDPYPIADSAIASLSITATLLLSRRYIEQWYLWMIVNAASSLLYLYSSLYLTFVLYIIYFAASVVGIREWRKYGEVLK